MNDPPNPTNTALIPEVEVKTMENFIDEQWPLVSTPHCSYGHKQLEDSFENGMRVPVSVLDKCGDFFQAADEK